jgi:hypothetical protein
LLALVVLATGVYAQERYGELRGEVTDQTGAVLPNAKVTARNNETNRTYETQSGGDGNYIITNVDPGRYTVTIEATGFTRHQVPDALIIVGRAISLNARLQVGGTEQTVQVTESAPLIDVSGTMVSHNVLAEEFDKLPKTRSFQGLVITAPSVNSGEVEGGFQVNGASGAENQFVIDGVSTTSLLNGRSRQNAVFEILQEVQVKTAGIDAEYGGALGGVISAITKSGGNDFHGDLHYYYYGNALSAGPTLRLALDPRTETSAHHARDHKNTDNNHEVGYSVGGRIIRDKLFFFSAASPRYRTIENEYILTNGVDSVKSERTYHQVFNKLSFAPWQRLRGSVQWLWSPFRYEGSIPAYNGFNGNERSESMSAFQIWKQRGISNPQNNYSGQIDITITPTSIFTLRGGRFWDNYKTTGIPDQTMVTYFVSATNLPFEIPANLRQPAGFSNIPRLQNTYWDITTRTYVQADYSLFARFAGQHNLKLGWGRQKTVNNVNVAYPQGGFVYIQWGQTLNRPTLGGAQSGPYGFYEVHDQAIRGSTGGTIDSLYIQDQWRVMPRLTLTLGLRTENEQVPSFRRDLQDLAFKFDYQDKLAPRVGASFDVYGDGRMKVFGSYARYYDWVKYELSRGAFGGDIWRTYYRSLDTTDVFSLSRSNMPGRDIWLGTGTSFRDRRVVSFDIEPDIKPMGTEAINAGVEMQIAPQTVLRTSYIHTDLLTTIEDIGVLSPEGDEIYIYGNPGMGIAEKQFATGPSGDIPMPKAKRTYDALEVSLTRRFSNGFFASANYTLSRLYGNYAGLANSDELTSPSTGLVSAGGQGTQAIARQGGNVNRSWDLDEILFDAQGNLDVRGRLATDRPHVLKLYGSKDFKWNSTNATDLGVFFYLGSGTPLTTNVWTVNHIPVMANGRGDMGRTPVLNYTDLLVGHEFRFGETKRLRFEFNALNLFNQMTSRNRWNGYNREQESSFINLSTVNLYQGFDYQQMINATPDARTRGAIDPRYGLDDIFNTGFSGRFGVKFTF